CLSRGGIGRTSSSMEVVDIVDFLLEAVVRPVVSGSVMPCGFLRFARARNRRATRRCRTHTRARRASEAGTVARAGLSARACGPREASPARSMYERADQAAPILARRAKPHSGSIRRPI